MIVIKSEKVYGIDVYTFKSSRNIPYQLTFEKSLSGKYIDVCLVNLLGDNDSPYCREIRTAVSSIAQAYIQKGETLFFNIEYGTKKNLFLFLKFIRWISLEKSVKARVEITAMEDIEYLEVYIKLNDTYIKDINVSSSEEE